MAAVRNWLVSLCVADGASVHVPLAGRKGAVASGTRVRRVLRPNGPTAGWAAPG